MALNAGLDLREKKEEELRCYNQNQFSINFTPKQPACQSHLLFPLALHPPHPLFSAIPCSGTMFALRGISGSNKPKPLLIENYVILNKRNNPMRWITTLANSQTVFFL